MSNFKYNIGDIVKTTYYNDLERVVNRCYDDEACENRYSLMDLYGEQDNSFLESSIIKPEKIKRIDMIMVQENPSEVLSNMFGRYCENYCLNSDTCGYECNVGIKEFLEQEIDNDINNIFDKVVIKHTNNEEINNQTENTEELNDFMKKYKQIVTDLSELCIKKNKDYGSSVVDTYEKFGDISYLTRITDKYNRILSLYQNKGEHEVKDESILDTALDMANYCLLWVANKNLNKSNN